MTDWPRIEGVRRDEADDEQDADDEFAELVDEEEA